MSTITPPLQGFANLYDNIVWSEEHCRAVHIVHFCNGYEMFFELIKMYAMVSEWGSVDVNEARRDDLKNRLSDDYYDVFEQAGFIRRNDAGVRQVALPGQLSACHCTICEPATKSEAV